MNKQNAKQLISREIYLDLLRYLTDKKHQFTTDINYIYIIIIFTLFATFMHIISNIFRPDVPSVRKPLKSMKFNETNKMYQINCSAMW